MKDNKVPKINFKNIPKFFHSLTILRYNGRRLEGVDGTLIYTTPQTIKGIIYPLSSEELTELRNSAIKYINSTKKLVSYVSNNIKIEDIIKDNKFSYKVVGNTGWENNSNLNMYYLEIFSGKDKIEIQERDELMPSKNDNSSSPVLHLDNTILKTYSRDDLKEAIDKFKELMKKYNKTLEEQKDKKVKNKYLFKDYEYNTFKELNRLLDIILEASINLNEREVYDLYKEREAYIKGTLKELKLDPDYYLAWLDTYKEIMNYIGEGELTEEQFKSYFHLIILTQLNLFSTSTKEIIENLGDKGEASIQQLIIWGIYCQLVNKGYDIDKTNIRNITREQIDKLVISYGSDASTISQKKVDTSSTIDYCYLFNQLLILVANYARRQQTGRLYHIRKEI